MKRRIRNREGYLSEVEINDAMTVVEIVSGTNDDPIVLEAVTRKMKDGAIFVTWTAGGNNEPSLKNIVKYKKSYDNGKTWDDEKILVQHPEKGMSSMCSLVDNDKLYCYLNTYTEGILNEDLQQFWIESDDFG